MRGRNFSHIELSNSSVSWLSLTSVSVCLQVWQAIERVLQEEEETSSSLQPRDDEAMVEAGLGHALSGLRASLEAEKEEDTPTFAQLAPVQQQQQPHFPVISLKVSNSNFRSSHIKVRNSSFRSSHLKVSNSSFRSYHLKVRNSSFRSSHLKVSNSTFRSSHLKVSISTFWSSYSRWAIALSGHLTQGEQ